MRLLPFSSLNFRHVYTGITMDLTAGIAGLRTAWDLLRAIQKTQNDVELLNRLHEAVEKVDVARTVLADARDVIDERQRENAELRRQLERFERWDQTIAEYDFVHIKNGPSLYKLRGEDAYVCPYCANERFLAPLQPVSFGSSHLACGRCKARVQVRDPDQGGSRAQMAMTDYNPYG